MKNSLWNKLILFFSLIALWQIASILYHNPVILPSPLDVFFSLLRITASGDLFKESAVTLGRGFLGAFIAFLIGILVGLLMGIRPRIYETLSPLVTLLQSTPVISWILLALIWFDNTAVPLFIIVIATAPTFIINISEGIRQTDPKLLEMASVFQVRTRRVITDIYIPSILGYLVSSIKIVFGLTYRTAVMAEVLAHPGNGIGEKMSWARINVETPDIIAWTLVIIFFAFLLDEILTRSLKKYSARQNRTVLP